MKLDITQVKKVAKLANLTLTPKEEEKFSNQLSNILGYIEELNSVDTSDIPPTFNVVSKENVLREDREEVGLTQEDALSNAPVKKEGFFVSKGVFKNE
ncbi:MAG TPA: Asp-tRNA(Asn)/Glu-tRNA(Gln) amidotransferase subunit GatC [Patescibacteria group bacterium]|nr:Asp-tRNA(Asn)/Glu-tRNA(Gln) amidotransferase subunit GatC [Patescibacteria group bacterium]